MGVKTIFKSLIGTVVVMVVAAMFIEYINISTSAAQMKGIMMQSMTKACKYTIQETYKDGAMGNVVGNMPDIEGRGGPIAGIGRFYMGSDTESVYNELCRSSEFDRFMAEHAGTWRDLDKLYYGLHGSEVVGGYRLTTEDKDSGNEYAISYYTAINYSIPYMDKDVLERIVRYNIIDTLSNGNSNNIYNDVSTSKYVLYKGFKIYYEHIRINSIDYTVYDTTKADDRATFEELTNVDTNKLGLTDDRTRICIANISYSITLSYQGISPLKSIMQYIWNMEVDNLHGKDSTMTVSTFNEDNIGTLDETAASGEMPVASNIVYYIVN